MKNLIQYFITGLAIILPLIASVWLIYYTVQLITEYLNFDWAALSVIIVVLLVLLIGFVSTTFLGKTIWNSIEEVLLKAPVFGLMYKAFKDLTFALVGADNKFSEPVLVKMSNEEVYRIGFITNKNADLLFNNGEIELEGLYAVYFPLSFSIAGDLFLVPSNRLIPITKKAKDVMQILISGGMIQVEK
jgi:uncharacterized membrane protein